MWYGRAEAGRGQGACWRCACGRDGCGMPGAQQRREVDAQPPGAAASPCRSQRRYPARPALSPPCSAGPAAEEAGAAPQLARASGAPICHVRRAAAAKPQGLHKRGPRPSRGAASRRAGSGSCRAQLAAPSCCACLVESLALLGWPQARPRRRQQWRAQQQQPGSSPSKRKRAHRSRLGCQQRLGLQLSRRRPHRQPWLPAPPQPLALPATPQVRALRAVPAALRTHLGARLGEAPMRW